VISHLLDTNVCIIALKKRSKTIASRFQDHAGRMAVSDITVFELYSGVAVYENPQSRIDILEDFLGRLDVLAFDSNAARHAGDIRFDLKRRGMTIGAYDTLIAGVARSRGLVLATNNLKEFRRVEGLLTDRWL
jgi:tRNA(fMet)-specific endonuclease VapC